MSIETVGVPFDVWVIHTAGDSETKRGRPDVSRVFSDQSAAARAAKGQGFLGGLAEVSKFVAMRAADGEYYFVGSRIADLDGSKAAAESLLRASILAKLTPEERRILGLEER